MEEDDSFPMTEQDDGVPQMEEKQDINMDVGITIIDSPSTSAFSLVAAADPIPPRSLHQLLQMIVADTPISTGTLPPVKINIPKALPEARGHTSYLTFACLIPIPGPAKASAAL